MRAAPIAATGLLLLGGCAAGTVWAGPPAWLRDAIEAAGEAVGEDAEAEVLHRDLRVKISANLDSRLQERLVLRILSPEGIAHATFQFAVPSGGRLKKVHVWTVRPDGGMLEADRGSAIESTYHPWMYQDDKTVTLAAPRARVGDVVALESVHVSKLPFPSMILAPQPDGLPARRVDVDVELPGKWSLGFTAQGVAVTRERDDEVSHFRMGPLPGVPDEPDRPELSAVMPRLFFQFDDPAGEIGFSGWEEVASWFLALAERQCSPNQSLPGLEADSDDLAAVTRTLAARVRDGVNYAAIELGKLGWVPDAAADTWRRRYGDCKDKSVVLVSALAARGIEAHPVLACTRSHWAVEPGVPNPGQFNHCIVGIVWPGDDPPPHATVKGPDGRAWTLFDPTASDVPFGSLPVGLSETWAVIGGAHGGLVAIPRAETSWLEVRLGADLSEEGTLTGDFSARLGGPLSRDFHGSMKRDERHGKLWARSLMHAPGVRLEVSDVEVSTSHDTSAVTARFRMTGVARKTDDGWIVRPPIAWGRWEPPPKSGKRALPVVLGGPARLEHVVEIRMPEGLRVELPENTEWSGSFGHYRIEHRLEGLLLETRRELRLDEAQVPADKYPEVRALWRSAYGGDGAPILLKR